MPQRAKVRRWLQEQGVETGIHYPTPIHRLVPYRSMSERPLPVVEAAADQVLSLPMFPHMSPDQIAHVCRAVTSADEYFLGREAVGA